MRRISRQRSQEHGDYTGGESTEGSSADWNHIVDVMRASLAKRLDSDRAELEDLVQEASLRILRCSQRTTVRNFESLARVVAYRTWVDYVRSRMRWRELRSEVRRDESSQSEIGQVSDDSHETGDPYGRLAFVMNEFFKTRPQCAVLADALLVGKTWKIVAEESEVSPESVRQQWSRCVRDLRVELKGEILSEFLRHRKTK